MNTNRLSGLECAILMAVQEAIEDSLSDTLHPSILALVIEETDVKARCLFSQKIIDRLRGQGPHNETLSTLPWKCGPYGREGRARGKYRRNT